tara:strand:+ start:142 stop:651 length:510 start_codon:yes stop_codon:yes gene_type:complete
MHTLDVDQIADIYTDYVFVETMNAPYPFKWNEDNRDQAFFDAPGENRYVINFEADGIGDDVILGVEFGLVTQRGVEQAERGGKQGVTGTGNAFRTFATVSAIIDDWIAKNQKPYRIEFVADDVVSRVRLYKRLAQQLARKYNMDLHVSEINGTYAYFTLSEPEPSSAQY